MIAIVIAAVTVTVITIAGISRSTVKILALPDENKTCNRVWIRKINVLFLKSTSYFA